MFYERFINEEDCLFSPHTVPGLYEAFGTDKFDALYKKYEKDRFFKTIPQELFADLPKERAETGRIYIMNITSSIIRSIKDSKKRDHEYPQGQETILELLNCSTITLA